MMKFITILCMILVFPPCASAQCERENLAFKAGESLTYDLYFNWKFVWVKAGAAHYKITSSQYEGKTSLRTDLLFLGNKRCNSIFPMKDTLISHVTPQLVPLYFRKGATEGKHYTVDEMKYTYKDGESYVKLHHCNRHGVWSDHTYSSKECNYDMLSILSIARSFDISGFKKGQKIYFPMATGKKVEQQTLIFRGKEDFEANDGVTYRCMVFSLLDYEGKKKEKELLRFYITDDMNHLPIRIDFYLKFGTAKAFYVSGKGLRNKQTSIVKMKK